MKKAFTQRRQNDQSHFVHKPYQFNYWIVLFSIFLFCGMSSYSFPIFPNHSSTEQSNTWTLMQSESGLSPTDRFLEVYYQEYTINSNTYLKFKIVNLKNSSVDFNWTLKKDATVLYQNINQVITASNEVFIDENVYVVPFSSSDNISSFIFDYNPS